MKHLGFALWFACALTAGSTGAASASPHGSISAVVDIDYFYDALQPYGLWVTTDVYGFVWVPAGVSADWRPYSNGYWTYTDYGWTWVDYAEWGWAPFHYGRWAHDHRYGWVWVPDTVWGPAWVAWRLGDGVIGWAPLPPEAHWRIGVGFVTDTWRLGIGIGLGGWCFVPDRHFTRHHVHRHFMPRHRAEHCFRTTRDVTDYGYVGDRIIERGIAVRDVERRTGQRVKPQVVIDRGPQERPGRTIQRGNVVQVHRPPVRPTPETRVMRPPVADRVVKRPDRVAEAQPVKARPHQERAKIERRDQPSSKRSEARRGSKDKAQPQKLQKELKKIVEHQRAEPRKVERKKVGPRRSEQRQKVEPRKSEQRSATEPQKTRTRRR